MRRIRNRCYILSSLATLLVCTATAFSATDALHYVNHWHLHQPIYWPMPSRAGIQRWELAPESIDYKNTNPWAGHPANDLGAIFGKDDRVAAYQSRPRDALSTITSYPEAGFTVSYTGALAMNVKALGDQYRLGYSPDWKTPWREARGWTTVGGKSRMNIVLTGFHHPFFPLLPDDTVARRYIQLYKAIYGEAWGTAVPMSTGFWPLELAFSERMIPILKSEGINWTYVANSHLSRCLSNWPATPGNGMNTEPPNKAGQSNGTGSVWRNASIDGRPTTNELRFSYRPHYAQYIDPETGTPSKIIVVPCADYEGYVDGYSAFPVDLFDAIAQAAEVGKPPLVVLAHDGDNAWGGGYDSYMTNTPNKASGASARGYVPSTTEEYLANFPVDVNDIVHVEDGSWVNADSDFGSPTFSNWNWPWVKNNYPDKPTFDPVNSWDDNSQYWAIMTAVSNRVLTAESYVGAPNINNILHPEVTSNNVEKAWHYLLGFADSGHIYYGTSSDFTFIPIVAGNKACDFADAVIGEGELSAGASDTVPPTVWVPQRFPYNPGSLNYGVAYNWKSWTYPCDFDVFTFVYDASGLSSVKLKYRTATGANTTPIAPDNYTYSGGTAVSAWQEITMSSGTWPVKVYLNETLQDPPPCTPKYLPLRYWAHVNVGTNKLVDYYIEAVDKKGNVRKTAIQHVWVGDASFEETSGLWTPQNPTSDQQVTIFGSQLGKPGKLHWGVNGWTHPSSEYWPTNSTTTVYDSLSVETQLLFNGTSYYITLGPFMGSQPVSEINFCFHWDDNTWDNNGGADWKIIVSPADTNPPPAPQRLTPTAKNQAIDLSWEQVTGVSLAGYNIYEWNVAGSTYVKLASLVTWTTGYTVTVSTPSGNPLVNGTTYTYAVTSQKSTGLNVESAYSSPVTTAPVATDNIPPQTPEGIVGWGGVEKVNLSWTKNLETDLASYRIYRSTYSCPFGEKTFVASILPPGTTHQDTGLTGGCTYYYQLTSMDNNINESPAASELAVVAQVVPPPSQPQGLKAVAGNQKIDLSWNANSEADLAGYNLWCSTTAGYFLVNTGLITSTTYCHTSLVNGVTHYYKLTAVNDSGGESAYSSVVWAVPQSLIEVVFQVDMRGVAGVSSVAIAQNVLAPTWSTTYYAMTEQTGNLTGVWKITLSLAPGVELQYKYVMNGTTRESDFGTAPDNNRKITIAANNGPKMYVSNKWNVAGDPIPLVPVNLRATDNASGVLLNWDPNIEYDLEKYNIYRSTFDPNLNYSYLASATSTSWQVTGLVTGQTYYFKIDAQDLAGQKSGLIGPVQAIAGEDLAPQAPTGLALSAKNQAIEVRWNANTEPDLAGYFVRHGTATGEYPYSSSLIAPTTTFYVISGLTNWTTYYVVVRASDTAGNISAPSTEKSATPYEAPTFEERTIDGNFLDWKFSDVRALDPYEDTYNFGDGYDTSRDIVALYSREGQNNYYFRVDFHELGIYAENGYLDLYILIDCAPGGQNWLPDFTDTQTDLLWEVAICLYDATNYNVYNSTGGVFNDAFQGASFRSDLDSVGLAIRKSVLENAGWSPGSALNIQCFTTKDGTENGPGEITGSDVVDAIGATIDRAGGFLYGGVSSTATTGRAKYAFIYHGNQSLNKAKDIRDWIYREETNHTPTGYSRGLDAVENYGVKANIHVSGTLASAIEWAQPLFNDRIPDLAAQGRVAIIGGVLAEHIMPYFEDNAAAGLFVNSKAIQDGTSVLMSIYDLTTQPEVFWIPERVVRGQTFADILTNHETGNPTGYTATVLDDRYHMKDWFGMPDSQRFKLHKINGVYVFLINGIDARLGLPPGGDQEPDGTKFWNQDSGLHIETRKLLNRLARDQDQQQLVLVFDDWEAYSGRSFTSELPNDNADNWDKTVKWLASHQWIETVTLEDILSRGWTAIDHGTNISLPVKTYDWLTHACEGSYDNWYWGSSFEQSFANRVPVVRSGVPLPSGKTYGHINSAGTLLRDTWNSIKNAPSNQLKDYAGMVFNTLTYETAWHDEDSTDKFGPADTTYDAISGWALALHGHIRYAVIISSAARWAQEVSDGQWNSVLACSVDIDLDGEPEYVLKNNKVFAVFGRK